MSARASILSELKRRNVLRAGVLYIGAVWAISQGLAQLLPLFGDYAWIARWFVIACAIGFPFWIAFAWFYEFTPQGLKRESEIAPDDSVAHSTGRKLDKWIIAVLVIAVVLLLTNTFVWRKGAGLQSQAGNMVAAFAKVPAKSIAVLPFKNLSGDPNEKYFSDGITEEILNALAQIPDLKVAGRTSAFQFNSRDEDLRKIGETLGVANVLEGSVQKAGDEVRINVQLVDTRTGYQRWSEKYDRKLTNIFTIEDDISSAIAGKLRVQLTGGGGQALVAQRAIDPRAHDFYLRGLNLLAARGPGLRDAVAAFQNAVKIDPRYADAWGALAEAEMLMPAYFLASTHDANANAQAAAERALAIDPNNAAAYVALSGTYGFQWSKRNRALQRALQLAPGDAEAVFQHAYFLLITGNLDAALHEMDRALRLSPLSPIIGAERVETLVYLRRYDDALAQANATIAANPGFAVTYSYAAMAAVQLRRYRDAETYLRRAAPLMANEDIVPPVQLVRGIADPAQRAAALHDLANSSMDGADQAEWFCALGDDTQALAALERGLRANAIPDISAELVWSPMLDPIRNDPRFKAVLKKMGLPYIPPETKTQ